MQLGENLCSVCQGTGKILANVCTFCNGTKEWNAQADAFVKNHTCQCFFNGKQWCPVCHKKCHHNTPNRPKVLISPHM